MEARDEGEMAVADVEPPVGPGAGRHAGRGGGPWVPALSGVGLALAFSVMLMEATSDGVRALGGPSIYVYSLVEIACCAAVARLSRGGLTLRGRPGLLAAASLAGALGAALVILAAGAGPGGAGWAPLGAWALFLSGTALASGGVTVLVLAWYEELASLSLDYAMLHYVAGGVLVGLLRLGRVGLSSLGGAAAALAAVGICLLPPLSAACLALGSRRVRGRAFASGEEAVARWDFPWALVALLAVFAFASKVTLNLLDEHEKGLASVAFLICYGGLLAVAVAGFKRFPYGAIRYAALPLMVAGMLCQVNGPEFGLAGTVLTRVAQELLVAFVASALFDLSYRSGMNALWVFSLSTGCRDAGGLAANLLTSGAGGLLADPGVARLIVSLLIVLVVAAYVALVSDRALEGGWGLIAASGGAGEADGAGTGDERLAELCGRAARRYDLTRREEDVLRMRLKGASLKEVEDGLGIAHSTVKSHVRHIYAKLGAASIEEARAAVEAAGRGER